MGGGHPSSVRGEGPILQLGRVPSESFALTRRHAKVKQVWNFERFGIFIVMYRQLGLPTNPTTPGIVSLKVTKLGGITSRLSRALLRTTKMQRLQQDVDKKRNTSGTISVCCLPPCAGNCFFHFLFSLFWEIKGETSSPRLRVSTLIWMVLL